MNAVTGEIDADRCLNKWFDGSLTDIDDTTTCDAEDISPIKIRYDMLLHCLHFAHRHGLNEQRIKSFVSTFNDIIENMKVKFN